MAVETRTGGREATSGVIGGGTALAVGDPGTPAPPGFAWTELLSVARLETGHTPSRRHPEYWDGGIPWIGIKDATANYGRTIYSTSQTVTEEGIANSSARVLPAGTVCLSRTASVGYVVVMGVPMATSQDFVNWVCGPDLDRRYLKYVLQLERETLLRFASGTTHQTIYFPEAKAFHVLLPEIDEQRAIADVLGVLDDKIESNRRLTSTIWDLIGLQWARSTAGTSRVLSLGELVSLNPEKIGPGASGEVVKYIDISSVATRAATPVAMDWSGAPSRARRKVRDGDVIFSTVRPNRRSFALLLDPPDNCVASTGLAVLRPTSQFGPSATACVADDQRFADYLSAVAEGSAYPAVSPEAMAEYQVDLPPEEDLRRFERDTMPLRRRAARAETESLTLSAIRDTLLPEVLSGRLRVPANEQLGSQ